MIQKLAWVFGIFFLVLGVLGFIPGMTSSGHLLGIFEVDLLHNIIHVLSGVAAIGAALTSSVYSRLYFKAFGVIYAFVTVVGFVQGDTVFTLFDVNMADNVLHLAVAAIALYAGYGTKESAAEMPSAAGMGAMM